LLLELGLRAKTAVCVAFVDQALCVGLMPRKVCALMHDLFVPDEAEPLEALEYGARALVRAARFIGVFDAEQELATVLLHVQPIDECRPSAADV
jgi:hypothetical protein